MPKASGDWGLNFGGLLNLELDFTDSLATGDTVSSFGAWSIAVVSGSDPAFASRLTGAQGVIGNKTQHGFTAPAVGTAQIIYSLSAVANTTFGEKIPGWAFMVVTPVGGCEDQNGCC